MTVDADEKTRVYLCAAADVPPHSSMLVELEGDDFALFNTGDAYYAVTNRCPHEHAPLLGCPVYKGAAVVCVKHGWRIPLAPRADGRGYADGVRRLVIEEQEGGLYAVL